MKPEFTSKMLSQEKQREILAEGNYRFAYQLAPGDTTQLAAEITVDFPGVAQVGQIIYLDVNRRDRITRYPLQPFLVLRTLDENILGCRAAEEECDDANMAGVWTRVAVRRLEIS